MNDSATEIISRFDKSWTDTEQFFDLLLSNGFERLIPVREYLKFLKKNNENRHFRLGTSMYRLIISRSVDHGLREDQKRLIIDAIDKNDYIITFRDGAIEYREYRISDLNDERLSKLLRTLKDTLID